MAKYWRREQKPDRTHVLEVLCDLSCGARWSKNQGMDKKYMNQEAR